MRWHAWLIVAGLLGSLTLLGSAWAARQDAATPEAKVSEEQIEAWVRKLGHEEYRVREQAMKELEGVGAPARPHLERARESSDPEVRWRAESLLERLGRESETDRPSGSSGPEEERGGLRPVEPRRDRDQDSLTRMRRDLSELDQRIEEMMRRLDEDFQRFGSSPRWSEWFERFEDELDQPGWTHRLELPPGASSSRSFSVMRNGDRLSIQIDESGRVQAEIEENGARQTVKAETVEEFEKEFGDVLDRFGVESLDAQLKGGFLRLRPVPRAWPFDLERELQIPTGPRLGVRVGMVDEVLRHHLGIREGLLIDQVEPGSIAARLGLERWDVLVTFNGQPLDGVETLRRALGEVTEGEGIEVEIVRRGQKQTLTGTR